jgi:hypothetical protein
MNGKKVKLKPMGFNIDANSFVSNGFDARKQ